jgi:hypothetical protein
MKIAIRDALDDLRIERRRELVQLFRALIAEGEWKLSRVYSRIADRQDDAARAGALQAYAVDIMRRAERYGARASIGAITWHTSLTEYLIALMGSRMALRYADHVQKKTARFKFALFALLASGKQL